MDWSHALLTSEERRLFARLAVFSGSFDVEAATAVCCGSPIGPDQMLDEIQGLVDKSLLAVEFKGGVARYGMLDFVRQYACEHLDSSSEKHTLAARHRIYFRGWRNVPTVNFGVSTPTAALDSMKISPI